MSLMYQELRILKALVKHPMTFAEVARVSRLDQFVTSQIIEKSLCPSGYVRIKEFGDNRVTNVYELTLEGISLIKYRNADSLRFVLPIVINTILSLAALIVSIVAIMQ